MKSTEEKKYKKFCTTGMLSVIMWTLMCILFVWSFGNDGERAKDAERTAEARRLAAEAERELRSLQREQDDGQNLKLRSHEERLKVLETAVVDLLTANPRPESEIVSPAVRQDESASNAEAVSDEDFRAMVLKNAKQKDQMAIVKHFKQEDEFKSSLSRTQKKKFDADVKKAYEELLAECKINKGSLDKWQDELFRQSVETAVILEWRMDDYSNRQVAVKPVSKEQRQKKLEKLHNLESQLAELAGETESESE